MDGWMTWWVDGGFQVGGMESRARVVVVTVVLVWVMESMVQGVAVISSWCGMVWHGVVSDSKIDIARGRVVQWIAAQDSQYSWSVIDALGHAKCIVAHRLRPTRTEAQ